MTKKILVNAQNPEETRVAVLSGEELVDFDTECTSKKHIKGNIYLARVVRVEPSLQAVFIEYGAEHNGFLPFSEIHPDYYKIPIDDQRFEEETEEEEELEETPASLPAQATSIDEFAYPESMLSVFRADSSEVTTEEKPIRHKRKKRRRYSVQEVIFPKQVLLVQATKDERGSKCAAFTTYLSLAGQYCVLMPNAGERTGGISKRIQEDDTRNRLRSIVKDLNVPEKMSIIIRTAGQERTKVEIRRDFDYLSRLWDEIRSKTLESNAPLLIHAEADVLARAVRDFYQKDVEEILVDTQDAYKKLRLFMKQLSPSGVKKIKLYKDVDNVSLFNAFDIERQVVAMVTPRVPLPSGGSLVIGQTEALVAIDVNSGRATRERNIDTTALKTNLEAAREIARQLRLRDLSGLIVIDFIDMSEHRHNIQVEKEFRQQVALDRARIQLGTISQFGLLELSRQRLRSSVMEIYSEICPHCQGRGMTYSRQYFVSTVLHALEKAVSTEEISLAHLYTPSTITDLLLNQNRKSICDMETKYNCSITIHTDDNLSDVDFMIDTGKGAPSLLSLVKSPEESEEEKQPAKGTNTSPRKHHQTSTATPQVNQPAERGDHQSANSLPEVAKEVHEENEPSSEPAVSDEVTKEQTFDQRGSPFGPHRRRRNRYFRRFRDNNTFVDQKGSSIDHPSQVDAEVAEAVASKPKDMALPYSLPTDSKTPATVESTLDETTPDLEENSASNAGREKKRSLRKNNYPRRNRGASEKTPLANPEKELESPQQSPLLSAATSSSLPQPVSVLPALGEKVQEEPGRTRGDEHASFPSQRRRRSRRGDSSQPQQSHENSSNSATERNLIAPEDNSSPSAHQETLSAVEPTLDQSPQNTQSPRKSKTNASQNKSSSPKKSWIKRIFQTKEGSNEGSGDSSSPDKE